MKHLVYRILAGDERLKQHPIFGRLASESGMVSYVGLVAILMFLVMMGLVANAGLVINQKIEIQNAADSTAYSSGTFIARGMNSVTASNHMIGELLAIAVLHHSIAGPEGDVTQSFKATRIKSSERSRVSRSRFFLNLSHYIVYPMSKAAFASPSIWSTGIFNKVKKGPNNNEGATIFRAKLRLMNVLNSAYNVYGTGAWMQSPWGWAAVFAANLGWPPNPVRAYREAENSRKLGKQLCRLAKVWAEKVSNEWDILDGMSKLARLSSPSKTAIRGLITALHAGTRIYATPPLLNGLHKDMLQDLDKENAVESATYFGRTSIFALQPELPIETEPRWNELREKRKSQLIRATYPWVNYWRQRPLKLFRSTLRLSRAAHHYKDFTNQFTYEMARELKQDFPHINLYIIRRLDLRQSDKGDEIWTKRFANDVRDQLFTNVGVSRRDRAKLAGSGFFRPENDDGIVAYSQAIVYNANRQTPQNTPRLMQPRVGWDTLNWVNDVVEYPRRVNGGHEVRSGRGGVSDPPHNEPRIFLNWQTKLVPVSRLRDAARFLPSKFSKAIKRLPLTEPAVFRTH